MTKKYKLFVLTNAAEGADEAFNEWYDKTHLRDVLKVQGFVSAQRFRAVAPMAADHLFRYCAIYDVEADAPDAAVQRLAAVSGTDEMVMSDALQPQFYAVLYEAAGDLVYS